MKKKILVTGGAGFIGSYLVDKLIELGHEVVVFDNLDAQVHGKEQKVPEYLNQKCKFIKGDMRTKGRLKEALKGCEVIFHQAAVVGVGQSMYEIKKYTVINILGTANLLDILVNDNRDIEKLIMASSMSVYGEGKYWCEDCGAVHPKLRLVGQLERREWKVKCPLCGKFVKPVPTDEGKPLYPTSVYAISKRDQEEMCLTVGKAYDIPTVALRYFNVYGPRQALSNPYTGVAAIFCSRILNNNSPYIFEDGQQSRDFIHVRDVIQANLLAMEKREANYEVFNVGTGRCFTVLDIANLLTRELNSSVRPCITSRYRQGDIRHCYADISKIQKTLGFEPSIEFEDGISDLVEWVKYQKAVDHFDKMQKELDERGLAK